MSELVRRHSLLLMSLVLLVTSFQLMSLSITNPSIPRLGGKAVASAVAPFQKIYLEVHESTRYLWNHYIWLINVESERGELLSRVKELEKQNSLFIELEAENERLRELVNFSKDTGYEGIAAQVIGRSPSNWVDTITINRGTKHGVRAGLAVVDGHAVVGQTTVVSSETSMVLLLTDPSSAIDAIVQNSRAVGLAEGTGGEKLNLRYVLKEHNIEPGFQVIASGLDGVFPKGVLIGAVSTKDSDQPGLFQSATIVPRVDFERLENILVLLPEKKEVISDD